VRVVACLDGGAGLRGKLIALGLLPGTTIKVMAGGAGRGFVLRVGDSRIVLSCGMAENVRVG
jgi:Fe2+ transport system protein FeoA